MRVYSFAASGAPLSQYLIWARHAVKDYGAQALLINVVSNDYDESLASYNIKPGFAHYVPDSNGELRLRLFEYRPGLFRNVAVASALGRYLIFNMQLGLRWLEFKSMLFGNPALAAPAHVGHDEQRVGDSIAAVHAFFRDLPEYSGLPPSRILFTVEGFRYADQAAAGAGGYFDRLRRAVFASAAALGYDAIDLDQPFFEHFRRTGERVDFPRDGHWNASYHRVVFATVMGSPFMARILAGRVPSTPR